MEAVASSPLVVCAHLPGATTSCIMRRHEDTRHPHSASAPTPPGYRWPYWPTMSGFIDSKLLGWACACRRVPPLLRKEPHGQKFKVHSGLHRRVAHQPSDPLVCKGARGWRFFERGSRRKFINGHGQPWIPYLPRQRRQTHRTVHHRQALDDPAAYERGKQSDGATRAGRIPFLVAAQSPPCWNRRWSGRNLDRSHVVRRDGEQRQDYGRRAGIAI